MILLFKRFCFIPRINAHRPPPAQPQHPGARARLAPRGSSLPSLPQPRPQPAAIGGQPLGAANGKPAWRRAPGSRPRPRGQAPFPVPGLAPPGPRGRTGSGAGGSAGGVQGGGAGTSSGGILGSVEAKRAYCNGSRMGTWSCLGGIPGPVQAGAGQWDQSRANTVRRTGAGTSPEGVLEAVEAREC